MQLLRTPPRDHHSPPWYRPSHLVLRLAALFSLAAALTPATALAAVRAPAQPSLQASLETWAAASAQMAPPAPTERVEGAEATTSSGQNPVPPPPPNTDPIPRSAPTGFEVPRSTSEPDLAPIAFPLQSKDPRWEAPRPDQTSRDRLAHLGMLELRDPFATDGQRIARLPRVPVLVPDLKDPFAPGARPVPLNWQRPQVPTDIRDPFDGGGGRFTGPPLPAGCATEAGPSKTAEGVVIQRPRALQSARSQEDRRRCRIPRPPIDLRDPFVHR